MKRRIYQSLLKRERGQAIILIAAGLIGLVAMVGLVVDTGMLFIEYGKLKRGVDAASIAAAQQYRSASGGVLDQVALENAAKNFIQLNQTGDVNIVVHTCESPLADKPVLCNLDPLHPEKYRKLVEVIASRQVTFAFLRVVGINGTTISTRSVGEAAALDLVLVIDTSASMAYETSGAYSPSNVANDPSVCNPTNTCQPMTIVKTLALDFIDTIYFPYDRVAIVSMTGQVPPAGRDPELRLPLTSTKATVRDYINGEINPLNRLKVFEPRVCDDSDTKGTCLFYPSPANTFAGTRCEIFERHATEAWADPSSCPSSNVGGALRLAASALSNPATVRPDAFWVVVALLGGPANATNTPDPPDDDDYPNGFCPKYTWLASPWCRDRYPSQRHLIGDSASYTNPVDGSVNNFSIYDADDFARDEADRLVQTVTGSGVTIYTIGLGAQIESTDTVAPGETAAGVALLKYVAECAGETSTYRGLNGDCTAPVGSPQINHGLYFFAPTSAALSNIFELIANNIATRISQ